jgi:outer membrane lipoprotein-sorting protein
MVTFLRFLTVWSALVAGAFAEELTSGDPTIDKILVRLETAGQTIKDLQCEVTYTQFNPLIEDKVVKSGEIFFVEEKPNSKFLVRFDKTVQEGVVDRKKEWHLFDGVWYLEARESTRQVIKRQIVPEGEKIDPFEIGKGPFPLPFGQKKDEILKNFKLTAAPAAQGDPPNTDHLVLLPKEGTAMADRYKKLEMWIDREKELPVRIFAQNSDDDKELTAEFNNVKRNTGFPRSTFQLREIKDWPEHVEKLEESQKK